MRLAEKEQLIRDVARLRRAERVSPAAEEIAAVRADLERAVGPTVSRAMAARLLGVSQTALDRWIAAGDVPTVIAPSGRGEVPVAWLAEAAEALEERAGSQSERHPLAAVLRQRRAEAERLDVRRILPAREGRRPGAKGHRGAELLGLAYHRAVAQRLDERLVRTARERLRRWEAEGRIAARYASRWEEILAKPLPRIARAIGEDGEEARELRQSSPFAGSLTEPERRRVLDAISTQGR